MAANDHLYSLPPTALQPGCCIICGYEKCAKLPAEKLTTVKFESAICNIRRSAQLRQNADLLSFTETKPDKL
jgi:hypothetical protein